RDRGLHAPRIERRRRRERRRSAAGDAEHGDPARAVAAQLRDGGRHVLAVTNTARIRRMAREAAAAEVEGERAELPERGTAERPHPGAEVAARAVREDDAARSAARLGVRDPRSVRGAEEPVALARANAAMPACPCAARADMRDVER